MDENNIQNEDFSQNNKSFKVPEKEENGSGYVKSMFIIFCTVLVAGIIFISMILKGASNIDLEIDENPIASMNQRGEESFEDNIRMQIDERLKMIQNEEDMPGVSEKNYETADDIINRLSADNSQANMNINDKKNIESKKQEKLEEEVILETVNVPVATPSASSTNQNFISKIYIGQFSDMQKAVELQTNIMNSGLSVMPIVKEVNGYYTVQAGAFTSYDSAKLLADKLIAAGFSAKVVRELR